MAFDQENHSANREETMSDCTATQEQQETFVQAMSERMTQLAQQLSQWLLSTEPTLAEMEQQVLQTVKELGNTLLGALASLRAPRYPVQSVPCGCGQQAVYQRARSAQVDSLLGCIHLKRAYYLCASCHHGQAPLDQQLGFCAGGQSAGLMEILALMGALCPFEEAVQLIQKLSLVSVSANSSKAATEQLGESIIQAEQQAVATAWSSTQPTLPPAPSSIPERLYVSMDGTTVHTRAEGWKEIKLGAFYTTTTHVSAQRPEQLDIRAQNISFYADFAEPQQFGRTLYLEGYRRGAAHAKEVVAIGDGAHWIWKLVAEHFPNAIQIVDWYHASQYVWNVAKAVYGEGTDPAKRWAHKRLDELWDGHVPKVLQAFQKQQSRGGEAVQQAISYYRNNQERMHYPDYRARGIQIGSGSIESGCKHLIAQRLKQAGMIWNVAGARQVAKVRARLKSGRWDETIALRQPPARSYQRSAA
jgi:Uncharacterised protein family (UPF0236)